MTVTSSLRRILATELGSASDAELLARFTASRDEAAFAALYARHGPMVRSVCRRQCRDPHGAADAEQGVWLVLARRAGTVSRPERLGNWLFGVAVRVAGKAAAAARPREVRGVPPAPVPEATASVLGDERLRVLDEELGALPEGERLALVLCYLEGRTQDEAARVCGTCVRTLRRRLARGRASLRRRLERRGVAPGAALGALAVVPNGASGSARVLSTALSTGPVPSSLSPWIAEELKMAGTKARWLWATVLGGLVLGGAIATVWSVNETSAPAGGPPSRVEPATPAGRAGETQARAGAPNDKPIRTVYLPMFNNRSFETTPYRGFEMDVTMAVVREIEKTTSFRVTSNYETADAELLGNIVGITKQKLDTDPLNPIRGAEIDVTVNVVWRDLRDGRILSNPRVSPGRAAPVRIVATALVLPEFGETIATGTEQVLQSLADQIVTLMEKR